ncbi:MAG: hypothetical protein R3C32_09255 [Chloroflexota bacterium]
MATDPVRALATTLAVAGPPLTSADRDAMWRDAGLTRDADGLGRQATSPVALVRLVATGALAREESRGGHFRCDFPEPDPALDGRHAVIRGAAAPTLEAWE